MLLYTHTVNENVKRLIAWLYQYEMLQFSAYLTVHSMFVIECMLSIKLVDLEKWNEPSVPSRDSAIAIHSYVKIIYFNKPVGAIWRKKNFTLLNYMYLIEFDVCREFPSYHSIDTLEFVITWFLSILMLVET